MPRTADVRTRTACSLLSLRRRDLRRVTRELPHVEAVLQTAYRERVVATALSRVPVFAYLDAQERDLIAGAMKVLRFRDGEALELAGDLSDSLRIVMTGRVHARLEGTLVTLNEGDHAGAREVWFPATAEVTWTCAGDTEVFTISTLR